MICLCRFVRCIGLAFGGRRGRKKWLSILVHQLTCARLTSLVSQDLRRSLVGIQRRDLPLVEELHVLLHLQPVRPCLRVCNVSSLLPSHFVGSWLIACACILNLGCRPFGLLGCINFFLLGFFQLFRLCVHSEPR